MGFRLFFRVSTREKQECEIVIVLCKYSLTRQRTMVLIDVTYLFVDTVQCNNYETKAATLCHRCGLKNTRHAFLVVQIYMQILRT
jgi:hypothetical protein